MPTEFLVELVEKSLASQLGDIVPGTTLGDFGGRRRLPELGFDLVLRDSVNIFQFFEVLRRHLSDDPAFAPWLESVEVNRDSEMAGYFTGSIDAVLAAGNPDNPRFVLVDYKSNRLGDDRPSDYDTPQLNAAMSEHHYQLQGLVYLVALHRFLRARLDQAYDYDAHIAGAAYLFLRGMRPDAPGSGVFTLRPPKACIEELSDLFDGSAR